MLWKNLKELFGQPNIFSLKCVSKEYIAFLDTNTDVKQIESEQAVFQVLQDHLCWKLFLAQIKNKWTGEQWETFQMSQVARSCDKYCHFGCCCYEQKLFWCFGLFRKNSKIEKPKNSKQFKAI